jgi:hypothetical protein
MTTAAEIVIEPQNPLQLKPEDLVALERPMA